LTGKDGMPQSVGEGGCEYDFCHCERSAAIFSRQM
jgi:hypothetical protein